MHRTVTPLITAVLLLVALGILVLMSASSQRSLDASYFVDRQLIWLALSALAAYITARFDYRNYPRLVPFLTVLSVISLILVRIPGIGKMVNGSWRWLQIGPLTLQPSEFAKPIFIMLMAWYLSRNMRRMGEIKEGLVWPYGLLLLFTVPILLEPDYGTTLLFATIGILLMVIAGCRWMPLISMAAVGFMGVAILIFNNPERMARIMAFLDPQLHEQGKAWQLLIRCAPLPAGVFGGLGLVIVSKISLSSRSAYRFYIADHRRRVGMGCLVDCDVSLSHSFFGGYESSPQRIG